ncbi:MAG: hypothetical protein KY429_03760 [Actinobacteria bacterium]|nr:hypothetical protein [Actinomycetota bacterium]
MMEVEGKQIEEAILKIPEVRAARLVQDPEGNPIEIHVVAGAGKSPKQLARDIQTVSMATFGIDLDHRIISIVQFSEVELTAPTEARPSIEEVSTEIKGKAAKVSVGLKKNGALSRGEASGVNSKESLARLAATATLKALNDLLEGKAWLELEHLGIQRAGAAEVMVVTLSVGEPRGITSLSGSAVVTGLLTEAVVRAVLDALNRRLFRTGAAE